MRILEVPGSNILTKTKYRELSHDLLQPLQANPGIGIHIRPLTTSTYHERQRIKFTLQHDIKTQRGRTGSISIFFNLGARWGWVVNATPRPFYPQETEPVPTALPGLCTPGNRAGTHCTPRPLYPRKQSRYPLHSPAFVPPGNRAGTHCTPRPLYPQETEPVPTAQEDGWPPGQGLDGCGKSRPHQDSIPGPSGR
jgi:hypothetical protein